MVASHMVRCVLLASLALVHFGFPVVHSFFPEEISGGLNDPSTNIRNLKSDFDSTLTTTPTVSTSTSSTTVTFDEKTPVKNDEPTLAVASSIISSPRSDGVGGVVDAPGSSSTLVAAETQSTLEKGRSSSSPAVDPPLDEKAEPKVTVAVAPEILPQSVTSSTTTVTVTQPSSTPLSTERQPASKEVLTFSAATDSSVDQALLPTATEATGSVSSTSSSTSSTSSSASSTETIKPAPETAESHSVTAVSSTSVNSSPISSLSTFKISGNGAAANVNPRILSKHSPVELENIEVHDTKFRGDNVSSGDNTGVSEALVHSVHSSSSSTSTSTPKIEVQDTTKTDPKVVAPELFPSSGDPANNAKVSGDNASKRKVAAPLESSGPHNKNFVDSSSLLTNSGNEATSTVKPPFTVTSSTGSVSTTSSSSSSATTLRSNGEETEISSGPLVTVEGSSTGKALFETTQSQTTEATTLTVTERFTVNLLPSLVEGSSEPDTRNLSGDQSTSENVPSVTPAPPSTSASQGSDQTTTSSSTLNTEKVDVPNAPLDNPTKQPSSTGSTATSTTVTSTTTVSSSSSRKVVGGLGVDFKSFLPSSTESTTPAPVVGSTLVAETSPMLLSIVPSRLWIAPESRNDSTKTEAGYAAIQKFASILSLSDSDRERLLMKLVPSMKDLPDADRMRTVEDMISMDVEKRNAWCDKAKGTPEGTNSTCVDICKSIVEDSTILFAKNIEPQYGLCKFSSGLRTSFMWSLALGALLLFGSTL